MRTPLPETLTIVDRLLDRRTGHPHTLAEDEAVVLLQQVEALGDPEAIPYVAPFLLYGSFVMSPLFRQARRLFRFRPSRANDPVAQAAAQAIAALMARASAAELARIDEEIRRFWRWRGSLYWHETIRIERLPRLPAHPAAVLGVLASHANGWVREAAVQRLAALDQGDELPFLLLRLNDWVASIRTQALAAVRRRLVPANAGRLVPWLPLVARLAGQQRVDHGAIVAEIHALLRAPAAADALRAGWTHADRMVRRESFRLAGGTAHIDWSELAAAALADRDILVRLWAAREVPARLHGRDLDRTLARMRYDAHMALRARALEAYLADPSAHGAGQVTRELEEALLDPSASIRHLARFHLRKLTGRDDFAGVYRAALQGGAGTQRVAIAGLGETGTRADAALVEPFVSHPRSKTARAALRALNQLDDEVGREVALEALGDARPGVCKTARALLAGRVYPMDAPQLWVLVERAPHRHARVAALALLAELPLWERLLWLLMVLRLDGPARRDAACAHLEVWLNLYDFAPYAPAPPEPAQLARLAALLDVPPIALPPALATRLRDILERERSRSP